MEPKHIILEHAILPAKKLPQELHNGVINMFNWYKNRIPDSCQVSLYSDGQSIVLSRFESGKSNSMDLYQEKVLACAMNGENLFITGKAGTGKTTLLQRIKDENLGKKVVAVLAPTGVAAENAGGYTMHSFLQLPLKPYLPEHKVRPNLYQLDANQANVICSIDMLIIDEISMVRCDMLDPRLG